MPVPVRSGPGGAPATDRPERRTLRQNLRGLPREVWVLFIGAFVNRLGTFVLPFITLYLTSRGYSVPQAGLGLAGYGLGAIGAQAVGGLLADRIGRRNTIVLSMLGGADAHVVAGVGRGTVADRPRRAVARLLRRALPPRVERARRGPRGARGEGGGVQRLPDDDQHRIRVRPGARRHPRRRVLSPVVHRRRGHVDPVRPDRDRRAAARHADDASARSASAIARAPAAPSSPTRDSCW